LNRAEEHDDLVVKLKSPEGYDAIEADVLRTEDIHHWEYIESVPTVRTYLQCGQICFLQLSQIDKAVATLTI
jgi:hypothetical protein